MLGALYAQSWLAHTVILDLRSQIGDSCDLHSVATRSVVGQINPEALMREPSLVLMKKAWHISPFEASTHLRFLLWQDREFV